MPQDHIFSSFREFTLPLSSTLLSDQKQLQGLSRFDYEQMCLALVLVARRIQELKSKEAKSVETGVKTNEEISVTRR